MDTPPQPVSGGMPYGHLEDLLKQNLEVAKQNHKILKRMERNALIGFVLKVLVWLIVLGVPIFFLSSYFGPLMSALSGGAVKVSPTTPEERLLGLPSAAQIQKFIDIYRAGQK